MKVIIAGEMPFLEEVGQLLVTAGHDTDLYLVEDLLTAAQSGPALTGLPHADLILEMHHESLQAKERLLRAISRLASPDALILTSALTTTVTAVAAWVERPERVVGFGLLPPIGPSGLVELAAGLQTAPDRLQQAADFWQTVGYEAVTVAEGPGLVRARAVCCLINEAASALLEGVASAEDIDQAMLLGVNYPHGPLAWADLIGLDAVLGVMEGLFSEWGEDRYRPSPLLRRLVAAGHLGQKTGRGFYDYTEASDHET
jgi:3-hydroxybutyryl-CoA dehydrogenase